MKCRGLLNAYGAYVSYYETNLLQGYSASDIAWPGTLQAVLIIAVGVLTGPLFDRGYIRSLMIFGSFMVVFGMMMLSLSSKYYQIILSQGLCVGIGSGIVYVPSLALVAGSFEADKRPIAIALATCGAAIGGVIYPVALVNLLPLVGFPWATRILGFMALFSFVIGIALVLWRSTFPKPKAPRAFIDASAFREVPFVAFCIAAFFIFLAYYVPFFYVPTYAQVRLNSSPDFSVYLLAIMNAATFPGRIASALAAKRFGALKALGFFQITAAIVLFCWFGVFSLAGLDVWVIAFGFTAGPLVTLPAAVVPLLCPNLSVLGTRMGMIWLFAAAGGLVGAPVAGVLNKLPEKDFTSSQGLIAASMTVGALLVIWLIFHMARVQKEH